MNEQAQKLLDRIPGFVFSAAGPVHVSRDLVALVSDGRIAVLLTLLTAQS